jgi:hypothetical protein
MRAAILQISDIHLRNNNNSIFQKIDAISKAIKSELFEIEDLIIVVSSDMAFLVWKLNTSMGFV